MIETTVVKEVEKLLFSISNLANLQRLPKYYLHLHQLLCYLPGCDPSVVVAPSMVGNPFSLKT